MKKTIIATLIYFVILGLLGFIIWYIPHRTIEDLLHKKYDSTFIRFYLNPMVDILGNYAGIDFHKLPAKTVLMIVSAITALIILLITIPPIFTLLPGLLKERTKYAGLVSKYGFLILAIAMSISIANLSIANKAKHKKSLITQWSLYPKKMLKTIRVPSEKSASIVPESHRTRYKSASARKSSNKSAFIKRAYNWMPAFIFNFLLIYALMALIPFSSAIIGFRYKLIFMNFSIFLIIILICFLLQLWLDNVFGDNFFFAMVYPPILIAPILGLEGPALQTFSIYVMLGYGILFYLILRRILPTHIIKRYLPCPACSGSVPIVDSWTCDHCREMQHKERHITAMCHCHRVLRTYFCPYCDKEFFL